jgi:hypothetical protein
VKQSLTAGGIVDLLTPDEYGRGVDKLSRSIDKAAPPALSLVRFKLALVDAGGGVIAAGQRIFLCPVGYRAYVARIQIAANLAANNAACGVYRNNVDPTSFEGVQLSTAAASSAGWSFGHRQSIFLLDGEQLVTGLGTITAGATAGISGQAWIERIQ